MIFHCENGCDGNTLDVDNIRPIQFLSKILTKSKTNHQATELEVSCLVWTCRNLRVLVQFCELPVVILTDHRSTRGVGNQTSLRSVDLTKLNLQLTAAKSFISYPMIQLVGFMVDGVGTGLTQGRIDALRKIAQPTSLCDLETYIGMTYAQDKRLQRLRGIMEQAAQTKSPEEIPNWYRHEMRDGLLYHVSDTGTRRLMIPSCVQELLKATHDNKHHFGP